MITHCCIFFFALVRECLVITHMSVSAYILISTIYKGLIQNELKKLIIQLEHFSKGK